MIKRGLKLSALVFINMSKIEEFKMIENDTSIIGKFTDSVSKICMYFIILVCRI